MASFWDRFALDPREDANAHLRASDRDRDQVHALLGDSFAEGRLTHEEFDERTDRVNSARTLGELPAVVSDLVGTRSAVVLNRQELRVEAERRYRRERREALLGGMTPALICWVIWAWVLIAGHGTTFPWPVFVTLGTGMRYVKLALDREGSIEHIEKRLRDKQEKRSAGELRTGRGGPGLPLES